MVRPSAGGQGGRTSAAATKVPLITTLGTKGLPDIASRPSCAPLPPAMLGFVKQLVRPSRSPLAHSVCEHCHLVICLVPAVGWLDPSFGDSYDICPDDPYGSHAPAAAVEGVHQARLEPTPSTEETTRT